jgi:ATP phosphoribosyltransferase regulatory subunit
VIPVTPRGFKDVLPGEARWRESIISATRATLALWGYDPIETPTLEVLEVLEQGGTLTQTPFRLFDTDNELLVLRPDVTLQVARMAASRLKKEDLPLRLRYVERVYREEESQRALSRQITQIGVEAIGLSGTYADAEMILLMVDALKAAGLTDFVITIGTVGVLRELLELCVASSAVDKAWCDAVLKAFHAGNYVAIDTLAAVPGLDSRFADILRELPTVIGKAEAITRVAELVAPLGIVDGLEQLRSTYAIIEACGLASYVNIDFSVVSSYDYYTGLVFEAYAPGLGKMLGNGGRYDRMLEGFGISAPAAGFAVSLESIMQALLNEDTAGLSQEAPGLFSMTIAEQNPAAAYIEAAQRRAKGQAVVLDLNNNTASSNNTTGGKK